MKVHLHAGVPLTLFALSLVANCQWNELPATGSPTNHLVDRTKLAGQSGLGPLLSAELVDKQSNARRRQAVVVVQTDGVQIVDPAAVKFEPKLDEAHIQYQLDSGPLHNSTSKTWIFHNLAPGEHRVYVYLVTSDNQRLGKRVTLTLSVP